jgi:hypothetical protein
MPLRPEYYKMHLVTPLTARNGGGITCAFPGKRQQGSLPLNSVWRSIQQFFLRPYWSYAWILQEVVLSGTVWVWCGSDKIFLLQISYVVDGVESIQEKPLPSFCSEGHMVCLIFTCGPEAAGLHKPRKKVIMHKRQSVGILNLVLLTSEYLAADPRDHISSKMNLSNRLEEMSLDYDNSVEEVYSDLRSDTWVFSVYHPINALEEDIVLDSQHLTLVGVAVHICPLV